MTDERGVAAVTVLMVTVVLAIAGGVVSFAAIAEMEMGARDRTAEDAFAAAEAGIDEAASYLQRNPTFAQGQTEVCLNNALVADRPEIPCEVGITSRSPFNGRFWSPPTGKPYIQYSVVSRAREGRVVTRTLAASYRVQMLDIPFGMFVNGNLDLNGTPKLTRESLLVNGVVTSREKLNTDADGNGLLDDPDLGWEFHEHRIVSDPAPNMCPPAGDVGCAGVFSNFQIYEKNQQKASDEIHAASADPATSKYPNDRDSHQAKVVNGEAQPVVTIPVSDILEPMTALKQMAESQGLYFNHQDGSNDTRIIQPSHLGASTRNFEKNAVIYIDADAGDTIGWKTSLIPESTASDIKYLDESGQRVGSLSGVIVVRGGSLRLESGLQWSGAVFAPENELRILGGVTCTCTIYAQGFTAQGGNSTVQLTSEWFTRTPAGFVSVLRESFVECEPYQVSAVCPAPAPVG